MKQTSQQKMALKDINSVLERIAGELNAIKTPYDIPSVEAMRLLSVSIFKDMQSPLRHAAECLSESAPESDARRQGAIKKELGK